MYEIHLQTVFNLLNLILKSEINFFFHQQFVLYPIYVDCFVALNIFAGFGVNG